MPKKFGSTIVLPNFKFCPKHCYRFNQNNILEVLFKLNRLDFTELVAALKGGSSKGVGFKPIKPGNFDGVQDRKVVDAWLAKMEEYLPQITKRYWMKEKINKYKFIL
jgi:hypothetical protein